MESVTQHKSFQQNEAVLNEYVSDAYSRSDWEDSALTLVLTCVRAIDFEEFAVKYGHQPTFDAPIRLFEALESETNSRNVFRCFQWDGFVTSEPVAIERLIQRFVDFPIAYTVLTVQIPQLGHRRRARIVDWIMMYVHRGIAEATAEGTSLSCTLPPELNDKSMQ